MNSSRPSEARYAKYDKSAKCEKCGHPADCDCADDLDLVPSIRNLFMDNCNMHVCTMYCTCVDNFKLKIP